MINMVESVDVITEAEKGSPSTTPISPMGSWGTTEAIFKCLPGSVAL